MAKFEAKLVIHRQEGVQAILEALEAHDWSYPLSVEIKPFKGRRNATMNRCLHLFCTMLATKLNDAGLDFRQTLKHDIDVPWTPDLVKEYMWRPVQRVVTGQESTRDPSNAEYSEIYDLLNVYLADRFNGLHVPWPSKETMGEENGN